MERRRAGHRRAELTLCYCTLKHSTESCEKRYAFSWREKSGTKLNWAETIALSGGPTGLSKTLSMSSTTASVRHSETRDWGAHHLENSQSNISLDYRWGSTCLLHTLHGFVVWLFCVHSLGNDPPRFSGTCAVCVPSQTVRRMWRSSLSIILVVCAWCFLVWLLVFHSRSMGHHPDSIPESKYVLLLFTSTNVVLYTVQPVLEISTNSCTVSQ